MRKLLSLVVFLILLQLPVVANEGVFDGIDSTNYGDTTQNLKPFTEKQYQDAIQQYKNKFQKPKKVKQKDIKTPTSTYSDAESNPEFKVLDEIINHKGSVMIPAICVTEYGQEVKPGYYTLEYNLDNNGYQWLILSQGNVKIAKMPARKTAVTGNEDTINYAYAIGKNDTIKLLYGNIDIAVESVLVVLN